MNEVQVRSNCQNSDLAIEDILNVINAPVALLATTQS
jgi:hypothetical protein